MSKQPVKEDPAQAKVYPQDKSTVAAEGEQAPEGRYHGLSPEQVKKIEDARYDDTDTTTPIDDGIDAQRAKETAAAEKAEQERLADEAEAAEKAEKKKQKE
jgi:hypothetical protein